MLIRLRYDADERLDIVPGKSQFAEALFASSEWTATEGGRLLRVMLHPKRPITLRDLRVELDLDYGPVEGVLCNGLQSWSESYELPPQGRVPRPHALARHLFGYYGDAYTGLPPARGPHSWAYTWLRQGAHYRLFASLDEGHAWTLFAHDARAGRLSIVRDCAGLALPHSWPAFSLFFAEGESLPALFDAYAKLAGWPAPRPLPRLGWTSWYYHYRRISAPVLREQLAHWQAASPRPELFQIDDGWQRAVGDWQMRPDFGAEMATLRREIHAAGMKAGLWLAPFACERRSALAQQHPDWLLKDAKGRPLRAGYNPLWGGWYYALDIYHKGVREYLAGVFHIVLAQWGYDMLKLDFLFVACIAPPPGRTRGQVMQDAMHLLRQYCGEKLMLACGVPLGNAFGVADYCRVGPDVHQSWEHGLLRALRKRERLSTVAALRTVLARWPLAGRAFASDPDVLVLREERTRLNAEQQHTLATLNGLLGTVLFSSDDWAKLGPEQQAEWAASSEWQGAQIEAVRPLAQREVYAIRFVQGGRRYLALANLGRRAQTLQEGPWPLRLAAYQTEVLAL